LKNVRPLSAARRKAQRLQKLGSERPFCLLCGSREPMVLRTVTRRFLEDHHILGRAREPHLTLSLCFNCHALVTEGLLQAGVGMERESDPRKFTSSVFRALSVHHRALSDAFWRMADWVDGMEYE
jgi:hypothetical protein